MATTNKYDRQIRLWGARGQQALAECCVVLIRATAVGTETLKNLVLPGIGGILILDDVTIKNDSSKNNSSSMEHYSNFFLVDPQQHQATSVSSATTDENEGTKTTTTTSTTTSIPRARMAMEYLSELNADVRVSWQHVDSLQHANLATLVQQQQSQSQSQHEQIQQYLIVASDCEPSLLNYVATTCEQWGWPLVAVYGYGFMGIVRLQVAPPAMAIIDPNPRRHHALADLRLLHPPTALLEWVHNEFCNDMWSQLDRAKQKHVPYPILLLIVMAEYRADHDNQVPSSFDEKQDFVARIKKLCKKNDVTYDDALNFQEAVQNAYMAYSERSMDWDHVDHMLQVITDKQQQQQQSQTESVSWPPPLSLLRFNVMLQALRLFGQRHNGQAPIQGTIPDMTASTAWYVRLQGIYQEQSQSDLAEMRSLVQVILESSDDNNTALKRHPTLTISDEELATFCHNSFDLNVLVTRSIVDEYGGSTPVPDDIVQTLQMIASENFDEDESDEKFIASQCPLLWYLAFRACMAFYQQHDRYPGCIDDVQEPQLYEQDVMPLQQLIQQIVQQYQLTEHPLIQQTLLRRSDQPAIYAAEMVRYANAEIHNIASLIGGVASQEAVKMITRQYVPIRHTYVYNGIASIGAVYEL